MVIPPDGEWDEYRILIFHARGVPGGPARPRSAYANILLCPYSNSRICLYTDVLRVYNTVVFLQLWITMRGNSPVDSWVLVRELKPGWFEPRVRVRVGH